MADLTLNLAITEAWTEVSSALSLTAGSTYLIDVVEAAAAATLLAAETDSSTAGPTVKGHPILPADKRRGIDTRVYKQRASINLWVRVDRGDAMLVATKVS